MQRGSNPYSKLGRKLSFIRIKKQASIHEVSGAVELEADVLVRIEAGEERPSEDILALLIQYFDVSDDEADELWELAGYNQNAPQDELPTIPNLIMLPFDTRIVYSDSVQVLINNFGVVMNFAQSSTKNQNITIARVGMSLEHAKSVVDVLSKSITQAESARQPRALMAPPQNKKQTDSKRTKPGE